MAAAETQPAQGRGETGEVELSVPRIAIRPYTPSIRHNPFELAERYRQFDPRVTEEYVRNNLGPTTTLYEADPQNLEDVHAGGNLAVDLVHQTGQQPDIIIAITSHLPPFDANNPNTQRVALQYRERLAKLGLVDSSKKPTAQNSPTFSAACSSFVFALDWLRTENPDGANVLIVVDETGYRRTLLPIEQDDQKTGLLMSDFAIALQGRYGDDFTVLGSETFYDPDYGELLAMRVPQQHEDDPFMHVYSPPPSDYFRMQGPELRRYFAREITKQKVHSFLAKTGVEEEQLAANLNHQASIRMVHYSHDLLPNIPYKSEGIVTHGNTSSASIPLDLYDAKRNDRIHQGDTVYMLAFGGGLTWGQAVVQLGQTPSPK